MKVASQSSTEEAYTRVSRLNCWHVAEPIELWSGENRVEQGGAIGSHRFNHSGALLYAIGSSPK